MKFKESTKAIKGITKLVDSVTNLTKSGVKMVSGISSKRAGLLDFELLDSEE